MEELTEFQKKQRRYWRSPEWKAIRQKVLERDDFTCVKCGEQEGNLQAHHCDNSTKEGDFEAYKNCPLSEIETLCRSCHMIAHGRWEGTIKDPAAVSSPLGLVHVRAIIDELAKAPYSFFTFEEVADRLPNQKRGIVLHNCQALIDNDHPEIESVWNNYEQLIGYG